MKEKDVLKNNPWRVVVIYGVFGWLWIFFSDKILSLLVKDIIVYNQIQTIKGWLFIVVTSILLYITVKIDYYQKIKLVKVIVEKNEELSGFNEEFIAINSELEEKIDSMHLMTGILDHQKSFYQNIYNSANVIMFTWRKDGTIIDINSYFEELLGFDKSIIGKNWEHYIVGPETIGIVSSVIEQLQKVPHLTNIEETNIKANGEKVHVLWNDALVFDYSLDESIVVSFGVNITNERIKDKELYRLAYSDVLTELGNSAAFEIECTQRINNQSTFALFLIDIDNFKQVNNVYDHFVGDEFLRLYAKRLDELLVHHKLYRWLGDEFLLIGDYTTEEQLSETIQTIETLTNQSWKLTKVEYKPTACIGVAIYPNDASSSMELFKNAEIALYSAKQKGVAQTELFSNHMLSKVRYDEAFTRKIDEALLYSLFTLKYQPIFTMKDAQMVGAEVLIRLEDGKINTQEMIDHAERTGQILHIDKWVINEVFQFVHNHMMSDSLMKISVNLSTKSFNSFDLITFLNEKIKEYSIDARKIQFEITEYTFIHNIEKAKIIMQRIRELGFFIALDDFGTKYSSLNYLKEIPLDVLKIDKSYVDHICRHEKDKMIVSHIVQLSKGIGLEVVAEGIEEECQKDVLIAMGCDLGQGYLFSRPLDTSVFVEWIDHSK